MALAQELAGQGLSPSEAAKGRPPSGLRREEVYAALSAPGEGVRAFGEP